MSLGVGIAVTGKWPLEKKEGLYFYLQVPTKKNKKNKKQKENASMKCKGFLEQRWPKEF